MEKKIYVEIQWSGDPRCPFLGAPMARVRRVSLQPLRLSSWVKMGRFAAGRDREGQRSDNKYAGERRGHVRLQPIGNQLAQCWFSGLAISNANL